MGITIEPISPGCCAAVVCYQGAWDTVSPQYILGPHVVEAAVPTGEGGGGGSS